MGEAEFAALTAHYRCCPAASSRAFFRAFCRAGEQRLQRLRPGAIEARKSEGSAEADRLSFRDFAEGVRAADPNEGPSQLFCFDVSLAGTRWSRARVLFLIAVRGGTGSGFAANLQELFENVQPVFRHITGYI
eukprot:CAMPEP_0170335586 /NCGR_PEP_ID=MMETSP0116_2-20130129/68832_1 /TAXON_ID=400756 /ORGANISM="Durinskia baltica, Strain CSIRO CS-38" /LENGTH=132 /DNA_ID=CAMNT_0010588967 /DNA_START=17 /DNA_END=415 /DNA_ORIENTATION=+